MTYRVDDLIAGLGFVPTEEQLAAITADLSRPLLVVAGAGSGKTTVMSARVLWAVATGNVDPSRVLGLTFTVKAAAQLAQRFRPRPATETVGEPEALTYHSFAHRLIAEHGIRIGVEPGCRLISGADQVHFAHRVVVRSHLNLSLVSRNPADVVFKLIALDGRLSEHSVSTEELRKHDEQVIERIAGLARSTLEIRGIGEKARARFELSRLVDDFRQQKTSARLADFADLMRLVDQLVIEQPEVGEIVRARHEMVLLDEYQDTSPVQTRFLAGLFGSGHPVTAVGDPLQGIFGWRAASAASIADFPRLFAARDGSLAQVLTLSINQRSSLEILAAANQVASPLLGRHPAAVELAPARSSADAPAGAPADETAGAVRIALFDTCAAEAKWVADRLAEEISSGTQPEEIAVLCRVGADGRVIVDELARGGVAAHLASAESLLDQPEVIEILSMLEAAFEPARNRALVRIISGPRWRIGRRDLAALGRRAADLARGGDIRVRVPGAGQGASAGAIQGAEDHGEEEASAEVPRHLEALEGTVSGLDPTEQPSLVEAVANPGSATRYGYSTAALDRFAGLSRELDQLRELRELPVSDLVSEVIESTGLAAELQLLRHRDPTRGATALAVVDQFCGFVDEYESAGERPGVAGFLAWVEATRRLGSRIDVTLPAQPGSVQVLTVHKAKGLEWDVVFVPFVSKAVFPSAQRSSTWVSDATEVPGPLRGDHRTQPQLLELTSAAIKKFREEIKQNDELDERQLAYVALTRARHRMTLSGHWWGPTQIRRRGPSVILDELKAADQSPLVDHWAEEPADEARNPALGVPDGLLGPVAGADPAVTPPAEPVLSPDEITKITERWDQAILRLFRTEQADKHESNTRTGQWSTSSAMAIVSDPSEFAARVRRPIPSPVSRGAREGTEFHLWVQEFYGQPSLFDGFDENPNAGEVGSPRYGPINTDIAELRQGFVACGYADRRPEAIEWPFSIVIGARVLTGQIDAVFATADGGWEVVDWKTNARPDADPFQLAVYRVAWSRIKQVPPERITGAFAYVRLGQVVRFPDLADEQQLAAGIEKACALADESAGSGASPTTFG